MEGVNAFHHRNLYLFTKIFYISYEWSSLLVWQNQHNTFNLCLDFNNSIWRRVQQNCSSDDCSWLLLTRASHQAPLKLRLYTGNQHDCLWYNFFGIRAFSIRNLHFEHWNLRYVINKTWILNVFFHIHGKFWCTLCWLFLSLSQLADPRYQTGLLVSCYSPQTLIEAKALLISLLGAVQNVIFEFLKTLKQGQAVSSIRFWGFSFRRPLLSLPTPCNTASMGTCPTKKISVFLIKISKTYWSNRLTMLGGGYVAKVQRSGVYSSPILERQDRIDLFNYYLGCVAASLSPA